MIQSVISLCLQQMQLTWSIFMLDSISPKNTITNSFKRYKTKREKQVLPPLSRRTIIVHFDVNKTIYMADPIALKAGEYVVKCALAEHDDYKVKWKKGLPAM